MTHFPQTIPESPPAPAREIAVLRALEKAHARLEEEHQLLKNPLSSVPLERRPFAFIDSQRARFRIASLCRRYRVTRGVSIIVRSPIHSRPHSLQMIFSDLDVHSPQ